MVALGDSILAADDPAAPLRAMMPAHRDLGAAAIVAVEQVPADETYRYGIVSIDGAEPPAGEPVAMTDIVEKPPRGSAPSTLAVAARYVFSPAIFEALNRTLPDRTGRDPDLRRDPATDPAGATGLRLAAGSRTSAATTWAISRAIFETFIDFALADERYGYLVRKYIKQKAYEL